MASPTTRAGRARRVVLGTIVALGVSAAVFAGTAHAAEPAATAGHGPATVAYGPSPHQMMDLFRPDPAAFPGPRPTILFVHPGGWISGDRTGVPEAALAQVERGYALASIDYQLAGVDAAGRPVPSFPGAVWDVKRAIRFLKRNADAWGLDPGRVVLVGASAGGHLAALAGATPGELEPPELPAASGPQRDSSVRGIVDIVGPTDLTTFPHTDHPWAAPLTAAFLGCPAPGDEQLATCADDVLARASVATYVDRTDPPILLAYGALDELVVPATQGEPLAHAWRDAHGGDEQSASYVVVETAGHTLPFEDTIEPVTTFLDRVTRPAAPSDATVVLYGDSLASEADTHFEAALHQAGVADVHSRTFGGTALCDWLDEMRADATDLRPSVVVLEFSGNAFTQCMQDASGVPLRDGALVAKYRNDAEQALRIFAGTNARVLLIGTPASRRDAERRDAVSAQLNAMYASLAGSATVRYADAGAAVLEHGHWTESLTCVAGEPCTGGADPTGAAVNTVRAPDGMHFCPAAPEAVLGVTGDCPVWSSGAFRFGRAMARSVLAAVPDARA